MAQTAEWNDFIAIFPPNESDMADSFSELMISDFGYSDYENFESSFLGGGIDAGLLQAVLNQSHPFVLSLSTWLGEIASTSGDWTDFSNQFSSEAQYYITFIVSEFSPSLTIEQFAELENSERAASIYEIPGFWEQFLLSIGEYVNMLVNMLQITSQPSNQNVCEEGNATFSISASGSGTISYQWRKNGSNIAGATSSSLNISNVDSQDVGNYDCVLGISTGLNRTSQSASLALKDKVEITAQPSSANVEVGEEHTFQVSASGDAPIIYQWRKNEVNISGATSSSLVISSTDEQDSASYDCVVSNSCGSETSNSAILIVGNPKLKSFMSNWSSYLQAVSFGYRNVIQEIWNYYISQGVSYEQFYFKTASAIQSDLEGVANDAPFYREYAITLKEFANFFANGEGSFSEMSDLMMEEDQPHYDELVTFLGSEYTNFENFKTVDVVQLATQIHTEAIGGLFLEKFAEMMVAKREVEIWGRLPLHFFKVEDREIELLVENIRDAGGANINSFKVLKELTPEQLAEKIIDFDPGDSYRDFLAEILIQSAKLTYQNFGEGDQNADIWIQYMRLFSDLKENAIRYLSEGLGISTVYQLSDMQASTLRAELNTEFFTLLSIAYLDATATVSESFSIQYRFIGRLHDDTTENSPLENWLVSAIDANDAEYGDVLLGNSLTNSNGYFETYFSVYSELEAPYQLDFTITDKETEEEYTQSKNFDPSNPKAPVDFEISVIQLQNSALISEVENEDSNLTIPGALTTYLNNNNLNTLEDIRLFMGLSTQNDLPGGTEAAAARIDKHANLELLKATKSKEVYIKESAELIDLGYDNIRAISKENRYDFVRNTKTVFTQAGNTGQYGAGKLYEQAKSVMTLTNNKLTEGLGNNFKKYENRPEVVDALNKLKVKACNCKDCKSGVSPLAYLADLINYTISNLKEITLSEQTIPDVEYENNNNGIPDKAITHLVESSVSFTVADLQERFNHPFADLPSNCNSVNKKVCQIRVTIEVLWTHIFKFIEAEHPDNITNSNDLSTAAELKEIRLKTYEYLLKELGTSNDELRAAKQASVEEREKIAQRIGIKEEHLDEFILEYSPSSDEISDDILESLFGYRNPTRNYKTVDSGQTLPNALVDTPKPSIESYKEDFLREQFNQQDYPNKPYTSLGLPIIDPDILSPDDFRKPDNSLAPFDLWQKRFNWLTEVKAELSGYKRRRSTFPQSKIILVNTTLSASPSTNIEVINYDDSTVNLTYLSHEVLPNGETKITVDETPPRILKTDSKIKIDSTDYDQGGILEYDLSVDYDDLGITTMESIFSRMRNSFDYDSNSEVPWGGFSTNNHEEVLDDLYSNLKNNQYYNLSIDFIQDNLSLNEDEFIRLYDLYQKNKSAEFRYESLELSADEWDEILDIMLISIKRKFITTWLAEETNVSISPDTFWTIVVEPVVKSSPFPYENNYFDVVSNVPLIDPDLINQKDLPDWKVGGEARTIFQERVDELNLAKKNIRLEYLSNGFSDLMEYIFGTSLAGDIGNTANDLASADPQDNYNAEQKIINEYHLSVEQFTALYDIKLKVDGNDPANQPNEDEWNALYSNLLSPYKIINLYPSWKSEEESGYFSTSPTMENTTWRLRKATLPKWRANTDLRAKWKAELELESNQATIDPYLISLSYLINIDENNKVLELWNNRKSDLENKREEIITDLSSNPFQTLNAFIEGYLGIEANFTGTAGNWVLESDDLTVLKEMQEAGVSIKKQLEQIGLNQNSFSRLFSLREILMPTTPANLTTDEKQEIANILISVHKKRLFSIWSKVEKEDVDLNDTYPFSLSPDFFQKPPPAPVQFPPKTEVEKPKYLFDQKAFKNWIRTLESRERIFNSSKEGVQQAVSDTEDAFLIPTRDAIIKHIAIVEEETVEETKDFITRNLLIDADMQCCSPTTRATQAIEALQVLLWGVHNQIIVDEPAIEQLSIEAPDFEEEWKWLGSYETWRAAMFVQLYPENILLPSIKPSQSEPFRVGLKSLKNARTKQGVNHVYTTYFEYIDDIKDADILANCKTSRPGKLTDYAGEGYYNKKIYFSFARGKRTKSYYFRETHILNSDYSITNQSEWIKVPLEIKGEFVGVQSCDIGSERIIYFFTKEDNELMLSIYDYKNNKWGENKAVEFESLQNGVDLSLEYKFYYIDMDGNPNKRPCILVYGYNWHSFNNVDIYNDPNKRADFTLEAFIMNKKGTADNVFYNKNRFFEGTVNSEKIEIEDRLLKEEYAAITPLYIYYEGNNVWQDTIPEMSIPYSSGALIVIGYNKQEKTFCKIKFFWSNLNVPIVWSQPYPEIDYKSITPNLLTVNYERNNKVNSKINNIIIYNSFIFSKKRAQKINFKYSYWSSSFTFQLDVPTLGSFNTNFLYSNEPVNQTSINFFPTLINSEDVIIFEKHLTDEKISRYKLDANQNINYVTKTDILDIPLSDEYDFNDAGKVVVYPEKLKTLFSSFSLSDKTRTKNYYALMQEGFYYLPLAITNELIQRKEFEEAKKYLAIIFDFKENEPIYYGFREAGNNKISVNKDWGENPLNPHDVAANRPGALKRSFYIQLINYFLAYADYEFTQDTVESIARARQLYLEARDLIEELKGDETDCNSQIAEFEIDIVSGYIREYWERIKTYLYGIDSAEAVDSLLEDITTTWEGAGTEQEKMQQIEADVLTVVNNSSTTTMSEDLNEMEEKIVTATNLIFSPIENVNESNNLVMATGNEFSNAILQTTGFVEATIETEEINLPFLEINGAPMPVQEGREAAFEEILTEDVVNKKPGDGYANQAQKNPARILNINFRRKSFGALTTLKFCVAPNPIIRAYELQVELNLYKIRNCMNIAGIQRSLEPFAAPTDSTSGIPMLGVDGLISSGGQPIPQASPYRFSYLIERAKELVSMGQQLENAFLSALEKLDDENYNLLKAKQDKETAKANIKLQDLRIIEAENGIKLTELGIEKFQGIDDGLQEMIDAGLNEYELTIINNYFQIEVLTNAIEMLDFQADIVSTAANLSIGPGSTNAGSMGPALAMLAILKQVRTVLSMSRGSLQTNINVSQIYSAQARREQEWNYQKTIAQQDIRIAQQQEKLAQDRLRIVNQEKSIAELRSEQTEATINFLMNDQFTNAALYEYMVEVLERVYSYFLQEATATAKLARNQLAFERQQNLPDFIKGDYWLGESEGVSAANEEVPNRRGITGSSRLLQDIYRLEQYADQTDQRKQQLTKTISLATIAPFEFQQFKESGLLTFATDMNMFDRDYPGHYLRLIKKVNVSVIALVPPVDGIKATFSDLGLSRVVTGGPLYQTQNIKRTPETISLSAPNSDSPVVALEQDNKMLRPFEGSGVETFWEFRMEKAANPNIDYNSIADVLVTIEYEAFNSFDYRARVIKQLNADSSYEAMLPISFKTNLPDQWFDISNPDQAETPFSVSFELNKNNFPVNVKDPVITNVLLYFPQEGDDDKEINISSFTFSEKGTESDIGGTGLTTNESRISTADANGSALNGMLGKSVEGTWKLTLTDNLQLRNLIDEEKLSDVLLVITFSGDTPKYNI